MMRPVKITANNNNDNQSLINSEYQYLRNSYSFISSFFSLWFIGYEEIFCALVKRTADGIVNKNPIIKKKNIQTSVFFHSSLTSFSPSKILPF